MSVASSDIKSHSCNCVLLIETELKVYYCENNNVLNPLDMSTVYENVHESLTHNQLVNMSTK